MFGHLNNEYLPYCFKNCPSWFNIWPTTTYINLKKYRSGEISQHLVTLILNPSNMLYLMHERQYSRQSKKILFLTFSVNGRPLRCRQHRPKEQAYGISLYSTRLGSISLPKAVLAIPLGCGHPNGGLPASSVPTTGSWTKFVLLLPTKIKSLKLKAVSKSKNKIFIFAPLLIQLNMLQPQQERISPNWSK